MKSMKAKVLCLCMLVLVLLNACTQTTNRNIGEETDLNSTLNITVLTTEESEELFPFFEDPEYHTEESLRLQAAYMTALNYYLNSQIDLDGYQAELDNSELNFPFEYESVYYKIGSFGRNNICLRNNLYVSRLESGDKKTILDAVQNDELVLSDEVINVIENTWKDIILIKEEDYSEEEFTDAPYSVVYDLFAANKDSAMTDSLNFAVYFSKEYDENDNCDDKYEEKKYNFINSLATKMETEISEKLNCNVTVFIKDRN